MYQAVPRKYRPQLFSSMVGQEAIVTTLKNALKFKRVAHAYLFCGSRGTGKTTLARLFAKALNCQAPTPEFEPCNQCPSCTEITSGRSLDVLEIDGASNRGIDDIRQLNETVCYAPSSRKYKIYIIDEVHMLTKEAFNALLKTLEEPPANVKFFLATTEPHKVLPTIISRCQRFDLNRIPIDQIVGKLKAIALDLKVPIEEEALALIAHQAEGGLRDAESLLDQLICYAEGPITYESLAKTLGLSSRTIFFALDQAITTDRHEYAFELAQQIFATGKDLACFLDGLLEHFRTLLLYKLQLPLSSYLNETDKKAYLKSAEFYTQEQCLYILDYLIQWQKELSKTPFKRITLEMILLHLIRSHQRIALPTLVRRLQDLEKSAGEVAPKKERAQNFSPVGPAPLAPPVKKAEEETPPKPLSVTPGSDSLEEKLLNALKTSLKEESSNAASSTPDVETAFPVREEKLLGALNSLEPFSNAMPFAAPAVLREEAPPQPILPQMIPEQLEEKLLGILHAPEPLLTESRSGTPSKEMAKAEPIKEEAPSKAAPSGVHQSRYDTLLRFAAVELEGIIKKD